MSYLLLWVLKTEATKKDRYRGFSAELKKKKVELSELWSCSKKSVESVLKAKQ